MLRLSVVEDHMVHLEVHLPFLSETGWILFKHSRQMNPQKSKTCEKPRNLYAIDVEVRRFHVVFNACTGFEYYGVLHQRDKTVPDHVDLPSAATQSILAINTTSCIFANILYPTFLLKKNSRNSIELHQCPSELLACVYNLTLTTV